ncbi:MAG: phosphatidylserine decarboxylase, partial [Gammaproteobacteria bacterium]|nr:phosphatidylserine decarboxylase [Gammaproteobacteria bacterium]
GWVTNRRPPSERRRIYRPAITIARGEEIMAFHLGSCVVMLLERDSHEWVPGLTAGREIRLGEALARPLA